MELSTRGRVDECTRDRAFSAILQHENAVVAAIDPHGLIVPLPASIDVGRHQVVAARTFLDLVERASRPAVITAWNTVLEEGTAHAVVDLDEGGAQGLLAYFDFRPTHGVLVGVLSPIGDGVALGPVPAAPPPTPRTALCRRNGNGVFEHIESDISSLLGWQPEDLIGHGSLELMHPDDQLDAVDVWLELLARPGSRLRSRARYRHRDGRWVWLESNHRNTLGPDGSGSIETELVDVTAEMTALEALRTSESRLHRLAESLPVGVFLLSADHHIVYANDTLLRLIGETRVEVSTLLHAIVQREEVELAFEAGLAGRDSDHELHLQRRIDGTRRRCNLAIRAVPGEPGQQSVVGCVTDVTEQLKLRAELENHATFDVLTGCVNRRSIMSTLAETLSRATGPVSVLFVDLDHVKQTNDAHGHDVGDLVLITAATRMRELVRAGDLVGRVGGDEFLIVCPGADAAGAGILRERLATALAEPLMFEDAAVPMAASIGLATTDGDATVSADDLIKAADDAMYRVKAGRGDRTVRPERPAVQRSALALQLARAVAEREFVLHYQPIVDLERGAAVVGYEALLRWVRDGAIVAACEFIAEAEAAGILSELAPWIVEECCRTAVAHPKANFAVNLSPRDLAAPRTLVAVREALANVGLDPSALTIEITEHQALVDGTAGHAAVLALADLGLRIGLDDFGTGASALQVLASVPAGGIKIDRRFVQGTATPAGRRLVAGMVSLARHVGVEVVAEGVETEAERDAVAELGIRFAQGYLFGRPAPLA